MKSTKQLLSVKPIPLIFVAPGITEPGSSTQAFAETVDVYLTLPEQAGLPKPKVPQGLDGMSLVLCRRIRTSRCVITPATPLIAGSELAAPSARSDTALYNENPLVHRKTKPNMTFMTIRSISWKRKILHSPIRKCSRG